MANYGAWLRALTLILYLDNITPGFRYNHFWKHIRGCGFPCPSGVLGLGKRWAPGSGIQRRWGGIGARARRTTLEVLMDVERVGGWVAWRILVI